MAEPLCPFNDGFHKHLVWQGEGRSGFSCRSCHKTWEWHGDELKPTYAETEPLPQVERTR